MAAGDRPYVVHVSGDFPDPYGRSKTPVIRSLLDLTGVDFRHRVVSLNRVRPQLGDLTNRSAILRESTPFEYGEALRYAAPARGILHATMLRRLGDQLARMFAADPPDLLVAHKLTIEGIAVAHAAGKLGLPYAVSIQGNTDAKILAARPDLRGLFARIFRDATMVFPFSPWALAAVEDRLGAREGPTTLLPCPTDLDQPLAPVERGDGLVSVFHLRHHRNKNLAGLVAGKRELGAHCGNVPLSIIGGGDDADLAACRALVGDEDAISITGSLDRADLRRRLNNATGFVLPSFRESFGLVFIEALFAGLPVIYPKGAAVDGYFESMPFAIKVDARDREGLAAAMARLVTEESTLKAALREWQNSAHALQFMRPAIAGGFSAGLRQALAARASAGHSAL